MPLTFETGPEKIDLNGVIIMQFTFNGDPTVYQYSKEQLTQRVSQTGQDIENATAENDYFTELDGIFDSLPNP